MSTSSPLSVTNVLLVWPRHVFLRILGLSHRNWQQQLCAPANCFCHRRICEASSRGLQLTTKIFLSDCKSANLHKTVSIKHKQLWTPPDLLCTVPGCPAGARTLGLFPAGTKGHTKRFGTPLVQGIRATGDVLVAVGATLHAAMSGTGSWSN
jgi:hypothetical protein